MTLHEGELSIPQLPGKENSFQGDYSLETFALVTPSTNWKSVYHESFLALHICSFLTTMRLVLLVLSSFDGGGGWNLRHEETWSDLHKWKIVELLAVLGQTGRGTQQETNEISLPFSESLLRILSLV